ncbi:MAG: hypothetical protein GX930_00865 [Clostridia bacterium]|nr:hypothetical protein [Clostridia bacterium]
MKIPRKPLALLSLFILLVVGCAGQNEAKNFLPLTPGNLWTYDVNIQGERTDMQVEVGQPREVEGKNAIPLSYSYNRLALPTQVEYYVIEDNAIVFPRIDNVQGQYLKKPFQVFLKFPLKPGAKWEWTGNLVTMGDDDKKTRARVRVEVNEAEKVVTHVATYQKAVKISFNSVFDANGTDFAIKEDRWYVKGVGMVKEVLYDETGEEIMVAILKKLEKKD